MDDNIARGANFIFIKQYIREKHGDDVCERILSRLPEDENKFWNSPLLATSTYSFTRFKTMARMIAEELGFKTDEGIAKLYEYIADQSLTTMHRIFFKLMSPAAVIGNYPKLWERFFTTGVVKVPSASKGHAKLQFDLPSIFLDWLDPACRGYSNKAVALAGGYDVGLARLYTSKLDNDTWRIVYDLIWKE